jgi:two-component system phosphate regulon response regulator PhoB
MKQKIPQILIAEDDLNIQRLVAKSLKNTGYEVMAIADGSEVLHYLNRGLPDLIILDWNLPNANGLQILQFIHRRDPFHQSKIILMTGNHLAQQSPEAQYADLFLLKPVSTRDLVPHVQRLLEGPSSEATPAVANAAG